MWNLLALCLPIVSSLIRNPYRTAMIGFLLLWRWGLPTAVYAQTTDDVTAAGSTTRHPLTPLTKDEMAQAVALLKTKKLINDKSRFAEISLQEPDKASILSWQPGVTLPRQVFIVTLEQKTGRVFEGVVDISNRKVIRWTEKPGVQPYMLLDEEDIVDQLVKADPRWRAAMRKRGITDFDNVQVDVWAAGYFALPGQDGLRLYRTPAYYYKNSTNPYSRPIENLMALIDINARRVIDVIDDGVVPVPDSADFAEDDGESQRNPLKPLNATMPDGVSFKVKNGEVVWLNWHFRFGFHPRSGLILYTVGYEQAGKVRPILYRASLSETLVPYGEASAQWFYRNAFDLGEYNLGRSADTLRPGKECPDYAMFFDAVFNDDLGDTYDQPAAACLFEQDGDILWKHNNYTQELDLTQRARNLVIRWIATSGNYDYSFDWIFHEDGTLEQQTTATGIVLAKAVVSTNLADPTAAHDTQNGTLVGPHVVAPFHQHFFSWRLDMDVDWPQNSVMEMNTQSQAPSAQDNPWFNGFTVTPTLLASESAAQRDLDWTTHRMWSVVNPAARNSLGHVTSYTLMPAENAVPYADPQAWVRRRANFISHQLWVTPYQANELYAAGDYAYQSREDTGLGQWTKANRPIANTDIVVWYTLGLTHIPRPEEWPVMSAHHLGFMLVPDNFFDHNPAVNSADDDH
ncbi:MAG: primary-amine oxidase [Chloroflexi bacterium]|nr:primary-amine oxidase [Chloroflexota bacterium]